MGHSWLRPRWHVFGRSCCVCACQSEVHMQDSTIERAPPSLGPCPLAGSLIPDPLALRGTSLLFTYLDCCWRRDGDTFRVNMAGNRMLVGAHPDSIKHVLWTNRHNYVKGRAYQSVRRIL